MTLYELAGDIKETIKCNKKISLALIAGAVIGINSMSAGESVNLDAQLNFAQSLTSQQEMCYELNSNNQYSGFEINNQDNENGIDVKAARKCGIQLK